MRTNRRPRSPQVFTSAQVAALAPFAWWKAGDLALADGAAVASWTDASDNGHTLTQATGTKQPTYAASGLGGLPSVRFSAANVSALATGSFTGFPVSTAFVVAKVPTTTPAATQYLLGGSSNGTRRDLNYTSGQVFGLAGSTTAGVQSFNGFVTAPAGSGAILTAFYNGTSSALRHDTIPAPGSAGGDSPNSVIVVGARNGQTASFDGWISEIVYFDKALTPAQVIGVERYLSRKYGVPLTQPGVVFVDGDNGNDTTNTGRSPLAPVKTATKGNGILGSLDGRMEVTGTLREQMNLVNPGRRLIKLKSATWYGSERHTSGWSAVGGGVYSKAVTGYSTSLTNVRVVSDLDADGFWTTLTPNTATPTTPGVGEFGFSSSTIYVHLAGGADPNTKTLEAAKFDAAIFSRTADEHVVRGDGASTLLVANRANILIGSAGTDGRMVTLDLRVGYGGDLGCEATQNDATSYKRYRCETFRAMNDGGNWHGTTGRLVQVYSEDCNDHHNYDEGESAHDSVVHTVRGGWKHHNVGGGGITNVMSTSLDADASDAGPLVCENNRTSTSVSATSDQGGISFFDATMAGGRIGPGVICRNNRGSGIYVNPGLTTVTVDPAAKAQSTGNALPDTTP